MASYLNSSQQIGIIKAKAMCWTTGPLSIMVAASLVNDDLQSINLSDTIGHTTKVPRVGKRDNNNCHWLHSSINENYEEFRQSKIHPMFVLACKAAGFNVNCKYKKDRHCILFSCVRGSYHNEAKSREYFEKRLRIVQDSSQAPIPRKRKSRKPMKEEDGDDITCKFVFRLYWDSTLKRWFLPHEQTGNLDHCGHMHVDPAHLRLMTKFAPVEEIKIAKDSLEIKISATASRNLLEKRTGIALEWYQLQYLKNKDKNDLVISQRDGDDTPSNPALITGADRLTSDLMNDSTKSFVALFGDIKSGLLTLKTKYQNQNNSICIDDFTEDLGDSTDSPEQFAKDLAGATNLKHSSSGTILLVCAWTTDEGRRMFDMFPEFCGGDDTEETNSEDRPLYSLLGKDNNNKSYVHTTVFMASKALWMFSWIFKCAVPILHPGTACLRIELMTTDADRQEVAAIDSAVGKGKNCL